MVGTQVVVAADPGQDVRPTIDEAEHKPAKVGKPCDGLEVEAAAVQSAVQGYEVANACQEAVVRLVVARPKTSTWSFAVEDSERHEHERVVCRENDASGSGIAHSLDAKDAADVARVLGPVIPWEAPSMGCHSAGNEEPSRTGVAAGY